MHECSYKGRPAIVVESAFLSATFLPEDGGKMASLCVRNRGKELLTVRKYKRYQVLTYDGDYVSSECSGFDDMFPTVGPYTPAEGRYQGITYPDHGEMCRIPYKAVAAENRVSFSASSRLFPIDYRKVIRTTGDGGITIEYNIFNHGEVPFAGLWAGHIMLQGEDGVKVFTPYGSDADQKDCIAKTEMIFATKGVPENELPLDRLLGYEPGTGAAYKFYYLEPMKAGIFGLEYSDGSRLTFEVDPQKIPYLGIWFNNGEFQDLYNIALEPCTVPLDVPDRAQKGGYMPIIPANSKLDFEIHITWKE